MCLRQSACPGMVNCEGGTMIALQRSQTPAQQHPST
jgi:hypothetical protein